MKRLLTGLAVASAALVGFAGPAAAQTGSQTFVIYGQGDEATVAASGPVSGFGQDFESEETESGVFVFPGGSITVDHPADSDDFSFNPVTCTGIDRFTGTYSLRSGTGAYAGITGTGTYRGRAIFVAERTADGCSDTEVVLSVFIVTARGTTTLP